MTDRPHEYIMLFAILVLPVSIWLCLTTYLAMMARWFRFARRFPDRPEAPLLVLAGQTGWVGLGVRLRGVLHLSACPSGLRVARRRLFAPLCGAFLAPWTEVTPQAETAHVYKGMTRLELGSPPVGNLRISTVVAQQLALAAGPRWPHSALLAGVEAGNETQSR
jgi:hypothetical protein